MPEKGGNQTILVATHNAGKLREISDLLQAIHINVIGADAYNLPEPEETGTTFEENAALKAKAATDLVSDITVLADDSGLEVDALKNAPGIYSARWAGDTGDFAMAIERIKQELINAGHTPEGQKARFVCVLALAKQGEETHLFRGTVEGHLTFPARGEKGFGYDPIFIANEQTHTFAEMDASLKHTISHRAHAFTKLLDYLSIVR